jgi:hypothetical protein
VIGAFVFFFSRTVRNRVRVGADRLKRPRYLVAAVAGLLYLYGTFFGLLLHRSPRAGVLSGAAGRASSDTELGLAVVVALAALVPWIFPLRGGGVTFREEEIQFLFAAPLGRRGLLHFRLVKGQIQIVFGVVVWALLFARGDLFRHPAFSVAGIWIVYTFLSLYNIAASLARTSPAEHAGSPEAARRAWLWLAAGLGALFALSRALPALPSDPLQLVELARQVAETTAGRVVLYPFRSLVRPALAPDTASFARSLVAALVWIVLAYLWVAASYTRFEEAARRHAEAIWRAGEVEQDWRRGLPRVVRAGRPWFRLQPVGPPFVAFFWKNLIAIGRCSRTKIVSVGAILVLASLVGFLPGGEVAALAVGSVSAAMALSLVGIGPVVRREDFRCDLLHAHLLKSYPVRGWEVALGEVLAPAAMLAVAECVLAAVAAVTLPEKGALEIGLGGRIVFLLAVFLIFPPLTLVGIVVQNIAVVLFPGWLYLGREHRQGVEAMGERMITMLGLAVVLVVAIFPAAGVAAVVGLPLRHWLGLAALGPAAAAAAAALAVEAALGIAWLGRLFDRFDPSEEPESLGVRK